MPEHDSQYGAKKASEPEVVQYVTEGNPSEVLHAAFIRASYTGKLEHEASTRIGKWLFFVAEKFIDNTWMNVRKQIEAGNLWYNAKVSTAWRSKGGVYVLCVYTYDSNDEDDVMKVRETLRGMGFKRATSYKTDEATLSDVYSDNAAGGVALYKA